MRSLRFEFCNCLIVNAFAFPSMCKSAGQGMSNIDARVSSRTVLDADVDHVRIFSLPTSMQYEKTLAG